MLRPKFQGKSHCRYKRDWEAVAIKAVFPSFVRLVPLLAIWFGEWGKRWGVWESKSETDIEAENSKGVRMRDGILEGKTLRSCLWFKIDQSKYIACLTTLPFLIVLTTDSTKRHVLEAYKIKNVFRAQSRHPPLKFSVCIQFSSPLSSPIHRMTAKWGSKVFPYPLLLLPIGQIGKGICYIWIIVSQYIFCVTF